MGPNKAATETKFFSELANRTSQAAGRASTFMFALASGHGRRQLLLIQHRDKLSTYFGEQLRGTCRRLAIATQQHR
jgi:hypothetical protein